MVREFTICYSQWKGFPVTVLAKITSRSQIMTKKRKLILPSLPLSLASKSCHMIVISFYFCHYEIVKLKLSNIIWLNTRGTIAFFGSFTLFLLENLVCKSFYIFFFGQMNLILNAADFSGKSLANLILHFWAKCPFSLYFMTWNVNIVFWRKVFTLIHLLFVPCENDTNCW